MIPFPLPKTMPTLLYCFYVKKNSWNYDLSVYPNSLISRFPAYLRPLALWVRNKLRNRVTNYRFHFDGVASKNNYAFLDSQKFTVAQKAVEEACGFDYRVYGRQHQAIWAAETALKQFPRGTFVELGTARGYMMLTILSALNFSKDDISELDIYCFDTFLPYSLDSKGKQKQDSKINFYYAESFEKTQLAFDSYPNVKLVKGYLPDTLKKVSLEQVSFLHIDLNNPKVEIECLELIWKFIPRGGLILIDDYAFRRYEETMLKFDNFAIKYNQTILTTAFGPGLMIKT